MSSSKASKTYRFDEDFEILGKKYWVSSEVLVQAEPKLEFSPVEFWGVKYSKSEVSWHIENIEIQNLDVWSQDEKGEADKVETDSNVLEKAKEQILKLARSYADEEVLF